ncbi:camphor resistance protein CrcB [Halospina denitrificans]|uniref:Fluoride-specific ion channel FluC n=1 Tax=Halospina denitrificans TaxID=332522 RepID=A0A4R7K159_9GAMM|nr:CrcB family protein [Halospina denitrificans]TDT44166.1 camphor resistance protein CrcB [Halospina denitrificans]
MIAFAALALGGALGGACRYLATRTLDRSLGTHFPWGTLVVNVSGAFVAGLVAGLLPTGNGTGFFGFLLLAGFCGSYTTVSSWGLQTLALVQREYYLRAAGNLVITTLLGLAAVAAGLYLARFAGGAL